MKVISMFRQNRMPTLAEMNNGFGFNICYDEESPTKEDVLIKAAMNLKSHSKESIREKLMLELQW